MTVNHDVVGSSPTGGVYDEKREVFASLLFLLPKNRSALYWSAGVKILVTISRSEKNQNRRAVF